MTMVRQTRQRQAVLEVLQQTRTHPDAAWIHAQVRSGLPSISLGTVYRTLDALVRDGVLMTIERAGQATRYDYKRGGHAHHHVVCRHCGAIHDLETAPGPLPEGLPDGFQVQEVRLEFHGVCADCQQTAQPR
ncbi:transcriptional repressor [Deinococcus sonorensis]|uniref:Transcriptional repressor n=2 Tax=Deinococcus sonorensis TaxID=309891 RepID=A0AAU7UEE2_9DEIO